MTRRRAPKRPPKPIKPMPVGRVCGSKGCTTILSRYNRQKICSQCHSATTFNPVNNWV